MQAVETLLPAKTSGTEDAFSGAHGGFHGSSNKGDDFDSVMSATLGGQSSRLPGKLPSNQQHASKGVSSTVAQARSRDENKDGKGAEGIRGKSDTDKKDNSQQAGSGSSVLVQGDKQADPNVPLVTANVIEQPPVFLSLPLMLSGVLPEPVNVSSVGKKTDTTEITATTGEADASLALAHPLSKRDAWTASTAASTFGGFLQLPSLDKAENAQGSITQAGKTAGSSDLSPVPADGSKTGLPAEKSTALQAPAPPSESHNSRQDAVKAPLPEFQAQPAQSASSGLQPSQAPVVLDNSIPVSADIEGEKQSPLLDKLVGAGFKAGNNAGTGVATIGSLMTNPQKMNKVAGQDVKVLPVGENSQSGEHNLPPHLLVSPVRATENRSADLNFSFSNGNGSQAPVAEHATALNVVDLPSLADARMRALDRTHDMMALHTMRLVESKSDTLSVIIKPAAGTELSLELRQDQNGVKAHATLMRGDHQFLSQHWSELQQRLEQKGIKLAPLGGETNFSANDNSQFRQQTSQEEAAQQASAFAEFAATTQAVQTGGATARVATVHDGWESWA